MYEDLARLVLIEEDPEVLRAVERVRSRHPKLSNAGLASRLTERAAWRCAAVGAAASAGAELLGRLAAAADLSYQILSLNRLAAAIARAHRRETTILERGLAAAGSLAAGGAAEVVRRGASRAARRALCARAPGLVPVVSALTGGAVAYAAAKIFARAVSDLVAGTSRRWR
jgi:hypothetical protein